MCAATVRGVLAALVDGDTDGARELARAAARAPTATHLTVALDRHLSSVGRGDVYRSPEAFEAFIDHGTNPELYARTIDHLREVHRRRGPRSVLDVGCGDGRVTAAVLDHATRRVDLVEPSEELLAAAVRALEGRGVAVGEHGYGLAAFLDTVDETTTWDLAHATFALHNLAPDGRLEALARLAPRVGRLVVVEFDVPDLAPGSAAHLDHLAERYEAGVAEYADHPVAIDGFLMPVLVGQLAPQRPRHTFEQPADRWVDELVAAGLSDVVVERLYDYWWGPAFAISANGAHA